jgi:hypothetical protein
MHLLRADGVAPSRAWGHPSGTLHGRAADADEASRASCEAAEYARRCLPIGPSQSTTRCEEKLAPARKPLLPQSCFAIS